jgi:hypothetical protein
MSFSQLCEATATWVVANLPFVVGGGVAVVVLTVMVLTHRRRGGIDPGKLTAAASPHSVDAEKAENWAPPEQSYADRRGAKRREGAPVRVTLASSTFRNGVDEGYVIDRSTGGLRIAMQNAIAPGSTLQVRAVNAPDNVGFVTVIVRSCRKNNDYYEVGCEFDKTPPWSVLLLFG